MTTPIFQYIYVVTDKRRLYIGIAFTWLKMASTEKREWRCLERNEESFKSAKGVCSTQKESVKCCIDCSDDISSLS